MKATLLSSILIALTISISAQASRLMPARFVWDRVYLDIPLQQGGALTCFTDSGGGGQILDAGAAQRLGLATSPTKDEDTIREFGPDARLTTMLASDPHAGAPDVEGPVIASDRPLPHMGLPQDNWCFLGSPWLAGHVWTWDYPAHRLVLQSTGWTAAKQAKSVKVGFRKEDNETQRAFPRFVIDIAGEATSMLLDTGATTELTPSALEALADGGPAIRATSMIVASRIEGWRKAHPEWRVIEKAQEGTMARMIEVPDVRIAGIQVGPVWFTERPEKNFHEVMSSLTDTQVEGAIGGNAFRKLEMTIDYPRAQA